MILHLKPKLTFNMNYPGQKKQLIKTRRKIFFAIIVLLYLYILRLVPVLLFIYFLFVPSSRERLAPVILLGLMAGYILGDLIRRKSRQIRILKNAYILRRLEAGERFPVGSKEYKRFREALDSMVGDKKQNSE
jgi:hypothetical protein